MQVTAPRLLIHFRVATIFSCAIFTSAKSNSSIVALAPRCRLQVSSGWEGDRSQLDPLWLDSPSAILFATSASSHPDQSTFPSVVYNLNMSRIMVSLPFVFADTFHLPREGSRVNCGTRRYFDHHLLPFIISSLDQPHLLGELVVFFLSPQTVTSWLKWEVTSRCFASANDT